MISVGSSDVFLFKGLGSSSEAELFYELSVNFTAGSGGSKNFSKMLGVSQPKISAAKNGCLRQFNQAGLLVTTAMRCVFRGHDCD